MKLMCNLHAPTNRQKSTKKSNNNIGEKNEKREKGEALRACAIANWIFTIVVWKMSSAAVRLGPGRNGMEMEMGMGKRRKAKRRLKCLLFIFAPRSNANHLVAFVSWQFETPLFTQSSRGKERGKMAWHFRVVRRRETTKTSYFPRFFPLPFPFRFLAFIWAKTTDWVGNAMDGCQRISIGVWSVAGQASFPRVLMNSKLVFLANPANPQI